MRQRTILLTLLVAALGGLSGPAFADRDAPIQNHKDIPVAWIAGGEPTLEQVTKAMIAGCSRRWVCGPAGPGKIRAVLYVRSHMAEVLIAFDTKKYSVEYVTSANLRYNARKQTIHQRYNLWVVSLISAINQGVVAANAAAEASP